MNPETWFATRSSAITAWLAALIWCGVAALAWFGYRASDEWQRSSAQLVERRTREIADLLVTALTRDMRAVQVAVLDSSAWEPSSLDAPYDLNDVVAGAFARYPYPEAFFAWHLSAKDAVFFARTERRPPWMTPGGGADRYPVEVVPTSQVERPLIGRVERDVAMRHLYSIFDLDLAGQRYQVIARIRYQDSARDRPEGVFGFVVNLDWVRQHYFSSITDQVARIAQAGDVVCAIFDDRGHAISGLQRLAPAHATARSFPVLFFDPTIVAIQPPPDLSRPVWSVDVTATADPTLTIASRGARRTLIAVGAGALALGLGLVVTVRAARASADTSAMRSDFVSTVTHGLKTPVSVIRGVGETLLRGRVGTPDRLREYAQLLVQESHRLTRLIDNLLTYARVADAADVYSFAPQHPEELIREVLKGFQRLLAEGGFAASISVSPSLPDVMADRTSLVLALDNLVDNAMRYSGDSRALEIRARGAGTFVEFAVIDQGKGIPQDDLKRVQRRFTRGRSTETHGSGLGLAIASRIATDHGGRLHIDSTVGTGTTAMLIIPTVTSPA